jgi:hypothetical protein
MSKYYIISLKRTQKNDEYFTFWRANSSGYSNFEEGAGKYSEEEVKSNLDYFDNKESTYAVDAELIQSQFIQKEYDGHWREYLPNNFHVRKILRIKLKQLK